MLFNLLSVEKLSRGNVERSLKMKCSATTASTYFDDGTKQNVIDVLLANYFTRINVFAILKRKSDMDCTYIFLHVSLIHKKSTMVII